MKGLLYAAAWFLTVVSAIYWIAQIVDPISGSHGPPIWLVAAFTSMLAAAAFYAASRLR
jgi:hypothetical protein